MVELWCWMAQEDGTVPSDPEELSLLMGETPRKISKILQNLRCFFEEKDGKFSSKRLSAETEFYNRKTGRLRANASLGGTQRQANAKNLLLAKQAESESESESDKEKEKDKEKKTSSPSAPHPPGKCVEVINIWNEATKGKLPQARITPKRAKVISSRLGEDGWINDFAAACAFVASTPFYCGQNDRGWMTSLDWVLQPGKATDLSEKAAAPKNNLPRSTFRTRNPEGDAAFLEELKASGLEGVF